MSSRICHASDLPLQDSSPGPRGDAHVNRVVSGTQPHLPQLTYRAVDLGRLLYGALDGDWMVKAELGPMLTAVRGRIIHAPASRGGVDSRDRICNADPARGRLANRCCARGLLGRIESCAASRGRARQWAKSTAGGGAARSSIPSSTSPISGRQQREVW